MASGCRQHQRRVPICVRAIHVKAHGRRVREPADGRAHRDDGALLASGVDVRHREALLADPPHTHKPKQEPVDGIEGEGAEDDPCMALILVSAHARLPELQGYGGQDHRRREALDRQRPRQANGSAALVWGVDEEEDVREHARHTAQHTDHELGLGAAEDRNKHKSDEEVGGRRHPPPPPVQSKVHRKPDEHADPRGHLARPEDDVDHLVAHAPSHLPGDGTGDAIVQLQQPQT
mmetsp:Transcript_146803/g.471341  ORF Transcript_146803/g.471341 Transcript_146803/m.471341 type:complete len:234 (-) Transcript_146803:762-1463(-)